MRWVLLNGEAVPSPEAKLHVNDLGLRRGYAVFDFLRVKAGVPLFLEDHLARFRRSAELAELDLPYSDAQLAAQLEQLVALNDIEHAGAQLLLTGGYSEDLFTVRAPNLVVQAFPADPSAEHPRGAKLITYRHRRELPEAKSTAYLTALRLGKRMASQGALDVIYHDGERVYEAARSGIAFVKGGVLVTAKDEVLGSVSIKQLLEVADPLLDVQRRAYTLLELLAADGVLVTGAVRGVHPVFQIDDTTIGNGAVGPHSAALLEAYARHVQAYVASRKGAVTEERA